METLRKIEIGKRRSWEWERMRHGENEKIELYREAFRGRCYRERHYKGKAVYSRTVG